MVVKNIIDRDRRGTFDGHNRNLSDEYSTVVHFSHVKNLKHAPLHKSILSISFS